MVLKETIHSGSLSQFVVAKDYNSYELWYGQFIKFQIDACLPFAYLKKNLTVIMNELEGSIQILYHFIFGAPPILTQFLLCFPIMN